MATARSAVTSDAIILLPGIMGSELVDVDGRVLWGLRPGLFFRQAVLRDVFERITPTANDGIRASRLVQWPVALPFLSSIEPYWALFRQLSLTAVHPDAVIAFPYDWRHSVRDAARSLEAVARDHLVAWRKRWSALDREERGGLPDPGLTLVCHSMGGLVASHFAAFNEGGEFVRRIVTLGTPFRGSLNPVEVLATGEQLPLGLFASALRTAGRRMPGLYELVARWPCVVEGDSLRHISSADLDGIGADGELAESAANVLSDVEAALQGKKGRRPPLRCLVGTAQATRQTVRFDAGAARLFETIRGVDERGDGTVFRYSAVAPDVVPSYLPQSHAGLAKVNEALAFVTAVLTERDLGEFQGPEGIGLRVPDVANVDREFAVDLLDASPGTVCTIGRAEETVPLAFAAAQPQDDRLVATFRVSEPGLYRISASNGGFSPVERMLVVLDSTG